MGREAVERALRVCVTWNGECVFSASGFAVRRHMPRTGPRNYDTTEWLPGEVAYRSRAELEAMLAEMDGAA
jgi:hypothetical protein